MHLCLLAQPTLPAGGASALAGDEVLYLTDIGFTPSANWIGGLEDHSAYAGTDSLTITYVDPASTTGGSNFPTATVAKVYSFGGWAYQQDTPDGLNLLGYATPFGNMACSGIYRFFKYPFTYGQSETTSVQCTGDNFGTPFTRSGQVVLSGDGYGSLVLPYGTVSNVLRVKRTSTLLDDGVNVDINSLTHEYYYMKPGLRHPVLLTIDDVTNGSASTLSRMLDPNSVGIQEAMANSIGMELYPVPASGSVNVRFGAHGHITATIMDATGRTVRAIDLGDRTPGIHEASMDLQGLAAGLYSVLLVDGHGGKGSLRLMVK